VRFVDFEASSAWLIFRWAVSFLGLEENDVSDSQAGLRPKIIAV
jgi:hypothetical protein